MGLIARPSSWSSKKNIGDTMTMKFNSDSFSTGGGRGSEGTGGKISISNKQQISCGGKGSSGSGSPIKNKKSKFSKGGGRGPG